MVSWNLLEFASRLEAYTGYQPQPDHAEY